MQSGHGPQCISDAELEKMSLGEAPMLKLLAMAHMAIACILVLVVGVLLVPRRVSQIRESWRWLRGCCSARLGQEEVSVREIAVAKRLEFFRICFRTGEKVFWVTTCVLLLFRSDLPSYLRGEIGEMHLANFLLSGMAASIYAWVSCIIFTRCPACLTDRTLNCWIVMTYVRLELPLVVTAMPMSQFMGYNMGNLMSRFLLCTYCSSMSFSVVVNLVFCITNGILVHLNFQRNEDPCPAGVVGLEFVCFFLICMASTAQRHLLMEQIRATMSAKSARNFVASTETLLRGMCDAVVQLNPNMTFRETPSTLNALLLRRNALEDSASGPRNETFIDFLKSDVEAERFRSFVAERTLDGKLPHTLHSVMRDANNTRVLVQLFHAQCWDALDNEFHIVGVREEVDHEHVRQLPAPEGRSSPLEVKAPKQADGDETLTSVSETSGLSNEVAIELAQQDVPGVVAVWIDTQRQGLPMRRCTADFFTAFGGPSLKAGSRLLAWIQGEQRRRRFQEQVQGAMEALFMDGDAGVPRFRTTFRPRYMKNCGFRLDAEFSVDPPGPDADVPLMRIACHNVVTVNLAGSERSRLHRPAQPGKEEAASPTPPGRPKRMRL